MLSVVFDNQDIMLIKVNGAVFYVILKSILDRDCPSKPYIFLKIQIMKPRVDHFIRGGATLSPYVLCSRRRNVM